MTDRLDQFLDGAVKAARSRAEAGAEDGAATRLRLRDSIAAGARPARSRKRLFTIIAAVIGSLFGSFAFAAYVSGWNPLSPSPDAPPAATATAAVVSPAKPARRGPTPAPAPAMPEVALPARVEPDAAVVVEAPVAPGSVPELPAPPKTVERPAKIEAPRLLAPHAAPPRSEPAPHTEPTPPRSEPVTSRAEPPRTTPRTDGAREPSPGTTPRTEPAPRSEPAPRTEPAPPRSEPAPPRTTPPPAPPQPAPATATSDDLADYRVAHVAHFRGGDPAAALAAWDAYLAKHGTSQLATDARYNRALVLIKLARYADARAALAPFARAPAGSYRQADAAKLLAALPK